MIVVTGAAGHLGNVLVRELLERGENVRALILQGEDTSSLTGLPVEMVEGNILDVTSLEKAFQGADLVYHMAAVVAITPGKEQILKKVNVEGTRNVLEAVRKSGVRRLVYTSSIHALTRPPHGVVINEELPFEPDNPAGAYDATKAQASLEVLDAVRSGVDAVIVCPTGVIGPHDYRRSEMGELILGWMTSKVSFLVEGLFDFVDVRDVATGHILAAEKGKAGEVYILSGEHISLEKMWGMVHELSGIYASMIKIPFSIAHATAHVTEWYYQIAKKRPQFTRYALETVTSNSTISYMKANSELGYHPRNMRETLEDTVTWWKQYRHSVRPSLRV
jgi:dihydroflavonol-4-reductase